MNIKWTDNLKAKILACKRFNNPEAIIEKYAHTFSADYISHFSEEAALNDILVLENMGVNKHVYVDMYEKESKGTNFLHIKLYQYNDFHNLSDILPIIDNFGIVVISENTYDIAIDETQTFYLSDFKVKLTQDIKITDETIETFRDAFINTVEHNCENDGFNLLALYGNLKWQEINIIRAYTKYLHQTLFQLSQRYIEKVMQKYPHIVRLLVSLFLHRNDLNEFSDTKENIKNITNEIQSHIDAVTSLDDDRILRRYLTLIEATLRSNYFQKNDDGSYKGYLALKIDSSKVPELPLPKPAYETFVYSARFEGIHLRSSKIARGGIRWSDRLEDYRTEILGLMKAQKVKNSIIVPSGAKGGFVIKRAKYLKNMDEIKKEATECYALFISGLLDLTDNIVNNNIIPPDKVRCHDDSDSYFVVAADKGTATFSDVANKVATSRNYWLGDAFASGGSQGYDHKKLGITARGVWESIKRYLLELNIDLKTTPITVAGIGDMSGDVFGNGMLYSDNLKLLAAFDHRHIFIDPNPDPKKSYEERKRLFNTSGTTWEDYDKHTLSQGGGVFPRNVKVIELSSEAQRALDINKKSVSPNELIQHILKAPVDLLYNGGVGTYIKASTEYDGDVGDKSNQFVRVNANELRCKMVGEGGNLGLTQLARIEYGLNNGLINSDFIDNSAGVDCSDHEVNIKILFNDLVQAKQLSATDRNTVLSELQDEVAQLVLKNNHYQALVMSYSSYHSASYIDLYQSHINKLELCIGLSREVECLPDDKLLLERKSHNIGLTRPELAVLLAYSKLHVKQELLDSVFHDNAFVKTLTATAFPHSIRKKYDEAINNLPLQKEIIATQASNYMLNKMGMTFPYRLQNETGAAIADVTLAFLIASRIYGSDKLQAELDSTNNNIPIKVQYELLHFERQLLNMATRWFLRNGRLYKIDAMQTVNDFKPKIDQLTDIIPPLVIGDHKKNEDRLTSQLIKIGLSEKVAKRFATSRSLFSALDIIEISEANSIGLDIAAKAYFETSKELNLIWLRDKLVHDKRVGLWNSLSRLALRETLDNIQKQITNLALRIQSKLYIDDNPVEVWAKRHNNAVERWKEVLSRASETNSDDYKLLFIALHELNGIMDSIQAVEDVVEGYSDSILQTDEINAKQQEKPRKSTESVR